MKKIISVFLVLVILCLSQMMGMTTEKVYASTTLSYEEAQKFVGLFYDLGSMEASNMVKILQGEKQGTLSEINSLCSNASKLYGIFNQPEMIESMSASISADYVKLEGYLLDYVAGAVSIHDNILTFAQSEGSMKKAIYGFKIGLNVLEILQLSKYVPSYVGITIDFVDLGITAGGFIEKASFMEGLTLYESDLMMAYYLGGELPYRKAPTLLIGSKLTQTEANALYAAKYLEYYFKDISDSVSGNSNGTLTSQSYTITFKSNCSDVSDVSYTYYVAQGNWYVPQMTRAGYLFGGWYADSACTRPASNTVLVNSNLTFYAKWVKRYYTIKFDYNCNYLNDYVYTYDVLADNWSEPDTPIRNGYIFGGWYWDSSCTNKADGTFTLNRDLTFYAKWTQQYKYSVSNREATITGLLCYVVINGQTVTDIEIPETIDGYIVTAIGYEAFRVSKVSSVTIPNSVTSIGDSAFYDCNSLKSVTIGNGVTSIGARAFWKCYNLKRIVIPDSVTSIGDSAFYDCNSLKSVTIPDSVTSIGGSAFSYCGSLTSVTIGNGVTSIGNHTFSDCDSLTSVTIPDSVTSISDDAFSYCSSLTSVTIPDSVTSIGNDAFSNCGSLTSINISENNEYYTSVDGVLFDKDKTTLIKYPAGKTDTSYTIPDSVTSIGGGAFHSCFSLTCITIPNSVTSINDYVFYDCSSLTRVTIPDSVTTIELGAFSHCSGLTSITIPDSVTSIGDYAFAACRNLTSITIPNSVTTIGGWAFYDCHSLTSITIPDSVTTIGNCALYSCRSLTSITIPDSVTSIGSDAFSNCGSLTSVTIPNSVTTIEFGAFSYCSGLTSITIPDSVTSIGELAFSGCNSLTSVTIPNSVTSIGEYAFYDCNNLKTTYYYGTIEQWNNIEINSDNESLTRNVIFVKHTQTTVSDHGKTFTVNPVNIDEGDTVIIALYKGDALVEMQNAIYESEALEFTTTKEYDTVKVMVWEDLNALTPVTEAEII